MDTDMLKKYELPSLIMQIANEIDGIYVIDSENDGYAALKDNAMLRDLFGESGSYLELSRILMFHFNDSAKNIDSDYHVFLPRLNRFNGKYSRWIKIFYEYNPVIIQMSIYPLTDKGFYALCLTEMDNGEYMQEFFKLEKENNISSNYLYTMHVDLTNDVCNSVNVSEMSDDPMNYAGLQYSQWRMMIVNMIHPDDREMFLMHTSPEYLRENLDLRRSSSFDCQMKNLSGEFIWVKLIFSRIETFYADDFRFVFMVQDIHESSMKLIADIKRYEELSNIDSLTGIYNHGKIENELFRCMELRSGKGSPLSLVMLDLDFFKNVNDSYGHATGDIVLKEIVSLAAEHFKPYDITLGRWGGEEFIGVCNGISKEELYGIAEKLREKIASYKFETAGHLTCSFGIIETKQSEKTSDAFRRVDKALYTAKREGRNRVVCGE